MYQSDELRKKKLKEMMMPKEQAQLQQFREQIKMLESIVKPVLTKEALSRYGTIKMAYPERAVQILVMLAQFIQTQNIERITDQQLKELLKKTTPEKKEFRIKK